MADRNVKIRGVQIAAAVAGVGLKKDGSGNLEVDLNELGAAVVDVSADEIAIIDATDASTKKESVADLVSGMAGTGITATNGVLSVDSLTDNVVETDIKKSDQTANLDGATAIFTLPDTPLANSVQVFLNGNLQQEGSGNSYTLSGTTVTILDGAPAADETLVVHYIVDNA